MEVGFREFFVITVVLIVSPRVKSVKIYTVYVCKFFLKQPEQANYKAVEMTPEISVIFFAIFSILMLCLP